MRSRFRRNHRPSPELDITAFMNLMVILVPFLLITAVFNQVTILDMNLPKSSKQATPPVKPPPFQLEIIIRKDKLQVGDKPGRILRTFTKKGENHDLKGLSELLKELKARFPNETTVTLLLEPEAPYNDLIQVMDTARLFEVEQGSKIIQAELFPDIALGDAPIAKGKR